MRGLLSASEQDTVMTLVTASARHCRAPPDRPGQHDPSERPSSITNLRRDTLAGLCASA
jgi:hypothetical protein